MFLTEKKHKNKKCPMTMSAPPVYLDGSPIRDGGPFDCIGRKCAAWQWVAPPDADPDDENLGFCGMSRQLPGA